MRRNDQFRFPYLFSINERLFTQQKLYVKSIETRDDFLFKGDNYILSCGNFGSKLLFKKFSE